ncbi:MAG: protein phosphatase [Acidobacteria bacterium]|nr:MAG: protein phosphatase [Acidobacteriota bacterium]
MAKTSGSSPIYVDFLDPADTGLSGGIGLTIAPGKKDGLSARDLEADLQRLRDHYHCDLLVSLMEPHEYEWLGMADLFDRARAWGVATVHFPIVDVDAPKPDEMPEFSKLVEQILTTARAGKTVVIHCRGGLGRSGTVAAACLVALGHQPADAIERVRSARPGAVESSTQERWVHSYSEARIAQR